MARRQRAARRGGRAGAARWLREAMIEDTLERLDFLRWNGHRALVSGAWGSDLAAKLRPLASGVIAVDSLALEASIAGGPFDLIVSLLTLHAVDDPVGALAHYARALKPDGLFLGAAFGEDTLRELRAVLLAAETEESGGAAQRTHPNAGVRDWGGALQRAGFALPVVDTDRAEVGYRTPRRLIDDLRGIGETAALADRAPPLRRAAAAAFLAQLPRTATFDIVMLTGWAPAPTQPKPLRPGSAQVRLSDALKSYGAGNDRSEA